jgi:hypothetical protein
VRYNLHSFQYLNSSKKQENYVQSTESLHGEDFTDNFTEPAANTEEEPERKEAKQRQNSPINL